MNFKKCLHGDKYATQAQRWLRKCAAELAEDESDDDDAVDTEVEGQKAEASTSKEVSPPQETAKDVNTAGESGLSLLWPSVQELSVAVMSVAH